MKTAIKIEGLSKKYTLGNRRYGDLRTTVNSWFNRNNHKKENFWALKDINLEVKEGEVLGIIGSNGAGKSTLLKILSKITPPTKGRITLEGRVASLLEVGTGFHPELTGRENIFLNGSLLGMRRFEIKAKFDEIVAFSGVEKFIDTPVKHYSSGMYVRLAFAVAAHLEPEILLVDEVLAVGDVEFQQKCIGRMDAVAKEGKTVLLVSHNLGVARKLCNRGVLLINGQMKAQGAIESVVDTYLNVGGENNKLATIPRGGTQGFKFVQIEMLTPEGIPVDTVYSGQEICFKLGYESETAVLKQVSARIEFLNELGEYCFICNSLFTEGAFLNVEGQGFIFCHIPKLPLNMGTYSVNVFGILDGKESDVLIGVYRFSVEKGYFYETGRLPLKHKGLLVDYSWSLKK